MDVFYVYVYLDLRKPGRYNYGSYSFEYEPFYVGKGENGRMYDHLNEAYKNKDTNAFKCNKIRKIKKQIGIDPIVVKVVENLSEEKSFEIEKDLIRIIGRGKNGPLTNLTDGGIGGFTRAFDSEEDKRFFRENSKKFWDNLSQEKRNIILIKLKKPKSVKRTSEQNKQISERNLKWWTEERKLQRGKKYVGLENPNSKYKYLIYEGDNFLKEVSNLREFCEDNKFPHGYIRECVRKGGKYKQYLIKRVKIKEV